MSDDYDTLHGYAEMNGKLLTEIEALRAENARLRAVIKFILDNVQSERRSNDIDSVIVHGETIRAARAAMGETE